MEHISDVVKKVLMKVQAKARASGHLDDLEQVCFKCGAIVEGVYLDDHPCYNFYCDDCENSWIDTDLFSERCADHADHLRKSMKENGGV